MAPSRISRLVVALALGAVAVVTMWIREVPIEPYLELGVSRHVLTEGYELWGLTVKARGGETIDDVRVESDQKWLQVLAPQHVADVHSGWMTNFRIQLIRDAAAGAKGAVRVVQSGRVTRTYDVPLVEPW